MRLGADGMNEDEIARQAGRRGCEHHPDLRRGSRRLLPAHAVERAEQHQALQVLARVLQAPAFPEAVLEREKARVIAGLKEADTKPDSIAARAFMKLVFGDHPYALRSCWRTDTVAKLTRDDLVGFLSDATTHADRAVVAIMGDVTRARAEQIAEELTARLAAHGRVPAACPPVPAARRCGRARHRALLGTGAHPDRPARHRAQ